MENELLKYLLIYRRSLHEQIYDCWVAERECVDETIKNQESYELYQEREEHQYRYMALVSQLAWTEKQIESERLQMMLDRATKERE